MNPAQFRFTDIGFPLVDTMLCPAITYPVLGTGDDIFFSEVTLHSPDKADGVIGSYLRVFRVAFVSASPVTVAGNRQCGGKSPVQPHSGNLPGSDISNPFNQLRITGGAETDIVWENNRTQHVGIAMDSVDAVDDRNRQVIRILLYRGSPVGIVHLDPISRSVPSRYRSPSTQNGTDMILFHLLRDDKLPFRLNDLPHFLVQIHPFQQISYLLFQILRLYLLLDNTHKTTQLSLISILLIFRFLTCRTNSPCNRSPVKK